MSTWMKFWLLWMLTGSPVTAALILLVLYGVADWYTFGFLRRVFRFFANLQRGGKLDKEILLNPHNRKARADRAEILVGQKRFEKAIAVLKPVLDADQNDRHALYLMGVACLGARRTAQGELFLKEVAEADPEFRMGAPWLEIGRGRLEAGDAKGAIEALTTYLAKRTTSVEGHFLMAKAYALAGDEKSAEVHRQKVWAEYATSLPYQQRVERYWAWRVRPSRPIAYGALALVGLFAFSWMLQKANFGEQIARAYGRPAQAQQAQQSGDEAPDEP